MSETPAPDPRCDTIRIGIVSISDRASTGVYEDKGLPALRDWLQEALYNPLAFEERLIPDEQATISASIFGHAYYLNKLGGKGLQSLL